MSNKNKGRIIAAVLWMFLISILLFWLPFLGPLIAGVVGGRVAGSVGAALFAVFLPAMVTGIALFFLTSLLTGLPVIGLIAGFGVFVMIIVNIGPLLLGAVIGGLIA